MSRSRRDPKTKRDATLQVSQDLTGSTRSRDASAAIEDLYAAVYANPDDLGARTVLADQLQEVGDPRGQFIALQLARAGTKKRASSKETALLREHALAWIGPLAPVLLKHDLEFANGFVDTATARDVPPGVFAPLAGAREWATIRALDVANWRFHDHARALALPHVRALRLDGISGLAHVPRDATRLEALTLEGLYLRELPALEREAAAWPALRSLTIEAHVDSLAELLRAPVIAQLAELVVSIGGRWCGWSIAFDRARDAIAVTFDDRTRSGIDLVPNRAAALRELAALPPAIVARATLAWNRRPPEPPPADISAAVARLAR